MLCVQCFMGLCSVFSVGLEDCIMCSDSDGV